MQWLWPSTSCLDQAGDPDARKTFRPDSAVRASWGPLEQPSRGASRLFSGIYPGLPDCRNILFLETSRSQSRALSVAHSMWQVHQWTGLQARRPRKSLDEARLILVRCIAGTVPVKPFMCTVSNCLHDLKY